MDIVIRGFRTKKISSRAIQLGDWLYERKTGLKHIKSFNHWELGYNGLTSGSIAEGTVTRNYSEYLKTVKGEVKEWHLTLSDEQWKNCKAYLDEAEGIKYEYEIFALYPLTLICGKWLGSKTMKRLYCVEHVIRALNASGLTDWPFNLWPVQLQHYLDGLTDNKATIIKL